MHSSVNKNCFSFVGDSLSYAETFSDWSRHYAWQKESCFWILWWIGMHFSCIVFTGVYWYWPFRYSYIGRPLHYHSCFPGIVGNCDSHSAECAGNLTVSVLWACVYCFAIHTDYDKINKKPSCCRHGRLYCPSRKTNQTKDRHTFRNWSGSRPGSWTTVPQSINCELCLPWPLASAHGRPRCHACTVVACQVYRT